SPCPIRLDVLPGRQEPSQRVRRDRFDLLPQRGERATAETAEDLAVHPLASRGTRPELALDDPSIAGESAAGVEHDGNTGAEALGDGGGGEGRGSANETNDAVGDRVRTCGGERRRHSGRKGGTGRSP